MFVFLGILVKSECNKFVIKKLYIYVLIIFLLLMYLRMFIFENRLNIGILKYNLINKLIFNIKVLLLFLLININFK